MFEVDNLAIECVNYFKEFDRLQTFKLIPFSLVNKFNGNFIRRLAYCGFYYTRTEDNMKCAFCNVVIGNWNLDNDPLIEHFTYSKELCPLLNDAVTFNQPLASTDIVDELRQLIQYGARYPQYRNYEDRLKTYKNWPIGLNQKPHQLAKAGFWYMQIGDKVKCFHCGYALHSWQPTDDPTDEHLKYFENKCDFIRTDYILKSKPSGTLNKETRTPKRQLASKEQLDFLNSNTINFEQLSNAARAKQWKIIAEKLNEMPGIQISVREWQRRKCHLKFNNSEKRKSKYCKNKMNGTTVKNASCDSVDFSMIEAITPYTPLTLDEYPTNIDTETDIINLIEPLGSPKATFQFS